MTASHPGIFERTDAAFAAAADRRLAGLADHYRDPVNLQRQLRLWNVDPAGDVAAVLRYRMERAAPSHAMRMRIVLDLIEAERTEAGQ